ncbi:MAG: 3-dehydroquinate synthase [Paenibacillaceae bacterium]|jgi:3-dehydroquinate synthase|nr:3-dehydroquinate synthase [Paenibacillaceae bacterium]
MSDQMNVLQVDLGERSYPIRIGWDATSELVKVFEESGIRNTSPLLIVTDRNVAKLHLERIEDLLRDGGYRTGVFVAEPGEQSKSLQVLEQIVGMALESGLDRNSVFIALGGGVIGDLTGYAAASYMRGVRFVQIPTTILAHDSSVGGKVAVNHPMAKNVIGAFYQPELVLFDIKLLQSLPPRDVRSGFAEVVKHGLIWDAQFTSWCHDNAERLLSLDSAALAEAIYFGCRVKAQVVSEDEREHGLRAILNLGHTIGHAIEAVAGYGEFLHGEAIAIGMVGAALLAVRLGHPQEIHTVTKRLLERFQLPVQLPGGYDTDAIMSAMMHDKKFKDGKMVFIIPTAIGKVEINKQVSAELVRAVVEELKGES